MIRLYIGLSVTGRPDTLPLARIASELHAAGIPDFTLIEARGYTKQWGCEHSVIVETNAVTRAQVIALAQALEQESILVWVPGKQPRLVHANPNKADTVFILETDL
jgi:hypothetical protein